MIGKIPLYLLAMAVGYFVALKATEEVGFLKHLGNAIAGILIVGSLLAIGWTGYLCYRDCTGKPLFKCPFQQTTAVEQAK